VTIPSPSCEPLGQDPPQAAENSLAAIDGLSDLLDVARWMDGVGVDSLLWLKNNTFSGGARYLWAYLEEGL
jgi:hypothetical protein